MICKDPTLIKIISFLQKISNHCTLDITAIKEFFNALSEPYRKYVGNSHFRKSWDELYTKYSNLITNSLNSSNAEDLLIHLILDIQSQQKYFYLNDIFHTLIKNLVDDPKLVSKYQEASFNYSEDRDKIQALNILQQLADIGGTYKLFYDDNLHFYILKKYSDEMPKEIIDREKQLLSKKLSKFIIETRYLEKSTDDSIFYPFYPFYSLETFIKTGDSVKKPLELSFIEKFVIILEILTGLKNLHDTGNYHGNIYHKSILISSTKDAYICGFSYDRNKEASATKPGPRLYYQTEKQAKKMIEQDGKINTNETNNDDDDLNDKKKDDIYSFAILMYSITAGISPDSLMSNFTRQERLLKISNKSQYCDFLFSKNSDDIFSDNDYSEIKKIIQDCMHNKFESFEKVIEALHSLKFYIDHKEEIDFRINNATSSSDYKCTIGDIVDCYLHGNESSLKNIEEFLKEYRKIISQNDTFQINENDDIIKQIFEAFELNDDKTYLFSDLLNEIVKRSITREIDKTYYCDDKMFVLSLNANINKKLDKNEFDYFLNLEQNADLIHPVFTLGNLIKDNKIDFDSNRFYYAYIIAKEIGYIHAHNTYIGNISEETIGIYYDNEKKVFVPSILLFYSFNKQLKGQNKNEIVNLKENIEQNKKNDIKKFYKILNKYFTDIFDIVIQDGENFSINSFLYELYNYFENNEIDKSKKNLFLSINDYSNFDINYSSLIDFKNHSIELTNSFININAIYQYTNDFLSNLISKKSISLNVIFANIEKNHQLDNNYTINDIITNIQNICSILYIDSIDNQPDIENDQNSVKLHNYKPIKFEIYNLPENKLIMLNLKVKKLKEKPIYRFLEISGIMRVSFEFLLKRYAFSFNPRFNYRITLKLNNQTYKDTQDKAFKIDDIYSILVKIYPKMKKPTSKDSYIIVDIGASDIF